MRVITAVVLLLGLVGCGADARLDTPSMAILRLLIQSGVVLLVLCILLFAMVGLQSEMARHAHEKWERKHGSRLAAMTAEATREATRKEWLRTRELEYRVTLLEQNLHEHGLGDVLTKVADRLAATDLESEYEAWVQDQKRWEYLAMRGGAGERLST